MRIISGRFGGRTVKTTSGPGYRPATDKVRGAVFSMLESRGVSWPGVRVLDLFAGSGSLGFEALSRGAEAAWFVEKSAAAATLIRQNLKDFGVDRGQWRVVTADVARTLQSIPPAVAARPFDVVFTDPPYGKGLLQPALDLLVARGWIASGAFVLAEVEEALEAAHLDHHGLELIIDRLYGQTRILLWRTSTNAGPSIPAPSTP